MTDEPAPMSVTDAITRVEAVLTSLRSVSARSIDETGYPAAVAPGELIESAWGNNVVQTFDQHGAILNERFTSVHYNAPGETHDTSTGGGAWVNLGTITPPDWATSAHMIVSITGVFEPVDGNSTYDVWPRFGSENGITGRATTPGVNIRFGATGQSLFEDFTAGAPTTLYIYSTRTAGTSVFRADGSSDFMVGIVWLT